MLRGSLLLLCALFAVSHVSAQQTVTPPHPLSNLPPAGLVTTGFFFPDHPVKQHFSSGEMVKVVLGMHNDASEVYNVTAIIGSLNLPSDFRMHVQNFTEQVYHQTVDAGGELSLEYKFMPDPRLDPREFQVALTVFYHDAAGKYFSNTFFNNTIEIVEVKKLIDWELIFLFVLLGGLAAAVVYLIYTFMSPYLSSMGLVRKGKKSKRVETSSADDSEEWLKGSNYENFKKKKAAAAAKRAA